MGESGQRRSTLVSRLPIFRRSVNKRQESLPSSPSSGGVGNGVHTSSPSSTNSSSSSTGKRRSLFRTPSISFHSKRSSESRKVDPAQLSLDGCLQASEQALGQDGGSTGSGGGGCGGHTKMRHSFGFGGHRHKKITRSQTEDFDKASSTSNNRNVFINCISSGANEGDDSGFLDDVSSRRSSKHKKQLLPKSFSAHHRFSKNHAPEPQCKPPEVTGGLGTPGSWPGELVAESSLQSPMLSEDRTTAITPSEFVHVTEDSVSEVDALPPPSPAAPLDPPAEDVLPTAAPTSQVFYTPPEPAAEKPSLPDAINASPSATAPTQCESVTVAAANTDDAAEDTDATATVANSDAEPEPAQTQAEPQPDLSEISESEPALELSEESSSNPEPRERRTKNSLLMQESRKTSRLETRQGHLRKPNTVSMCSSVSPYHEVMRLERRLRSASEGAGESGGGGIFGRRLHLSLKEPHSCGLESFGLQKQRTNSSSSKLGSLDVLNNLGSSELDEDDLMLDLDLSDDQRHRHVSREDSSHSLASCLNLMHSPMEPPTDRLPGLEPRDPTHRELRPLSSLLAREDELPGLEALPLRLMQQDCTAVKTLLLRLRRTLQESTDTSPASSLHSLPISPCSEKSLPFKDPVKEEAQATAALQQQLKEKDELIQRLQAQLETVQTAQKPLCQKADRSTQTDTAMPEAPHPGRAPGQSNSSSSSHSGSQRERRALRPPSADLYSRPLLPAACDPPCCPGGVGGREGPLPPAGPSRKGTLSDTATDSSDRPPRKWDHPSASQIPRAVAGSSSSLPARASPSRSQSSDSERGPLPHPTTAATISSSSSSASSAAAAASSFAGRLGQPPRGPLSLHMYSRKNVFLQHSLHTSELQALAQQDG
ncbi:serine-rich coiled-coil domain-containing protein 1 isoform X1 [Alosa pseudoharengus]|uniref:serine-rich coiled-coil domain-containing protein 1 isoform X1 n=2 Tax=Alosa pseudoharengus TaxID=34774 RepID=UPI003F8A95A1